MIKNPTLDQIRARAKQTANNDSKPVVILNLNRFSPLYVIRAYWDGCEKNSQYVETVKPD